MEIIWGNQLAEEVKADLRQKVDALKEQGKRLPVNRMFVRKPMLVFLLVWKIRRLY